MNALTGIDLVDGVRLIAAGMLVPAVGWSIASCAIRIGHHASAATRCLVWLLCFVSMAACVPFAWSHMGIAVPILSPKSAAAPAPVARPVFLWQEKTEPEPLWDVPIPPIYRISLPKPLAKVSSEPSGETAFVQSRARPVRKASWPALCLILWAAGVVLVALRPLVGVVRLRRIIRKSQVADDKSLTTLHAELCGAAGLRNRVPLLISADVAIPLVTGLWRPCIMLPQNACAWPASMLRSVLLHELAHLRRLDLLSSAFARFVVSLYWFNPLAWRALHALQAEAEMAADDFVVSLESQPVAYAESLVALVRGLRKGAISPFPAIGMLRRPGIEARVERILDPTCRRATPRRLVQWVACCGAVLFGAGFALLRPLPAAPVGVHPAATSMASAARRPFPRQSLSMEPGFVDIVVLRNGVESFVYHLPAGEGPLFGHKLEPLLSPARTTPFALAVEPNYITSVVYDNGGVPSSKSVHWNGNVDSPGPGYREQRVVPPGGEGFPVVAPRMKGTLN